MAHVLGHIARSTPGLHALHINTVFFGAALIAVFAQPVFADDFHQGEGSLFGLRPHQHVPMGRAIVVWLHHTQAIALDLLAIQLGQHTLPQGQHHLLAFAGVCSVELGIALGPAPGATVHQAHGVVFAGGGQRQELAEMAMGIGVLFGTANARHQLTATNGRVGGAECRQLA